MFSMSISDIWLIYITEFKVFNLESQWFIFIYFKEQPIYLL